MKHIPPQSVTIAPPLTRYLHDALTGQVIGSCIVQFGGARWEWIADCIANNEGCSPDDVLCIETEDGDAATVDGRIVAYIRTN